MKKEKLQEIMLSAWAIVKKTGCTMSEGMRMAWKSFKLYEKMKTEIVIFSFIKSSGEVREAKGTLLESFIPTPKGKTRVKCYFIQTFFDIELNEWRSFSKISLV